MQPGRCRAAGLCGASPTIWWAAGPSPTRAQTTAADHVDFVGFIRRYASQHPETKATIELLLFLDKIAQANRAILATVLDPSLMKDLTWTRDENRAAYNLVNEIRRYYEDQLGRRGLLDSPTAIDDHYDKVRLSILSGILRTTPEGYRASDARFLIGTIYWRQGKDQDALRSWREMKVDQTDTDFGNLAIAWTLSEQWREWIEFRDRQEGVEARFRFADRSMSAG